MKDSVLNFKELKYIFDLPFLEYFLKYSHVEVFLNLSEITYSFPCIQIKLRSNNKELIAAI